MTPLKTTLDFRYELETHFGDDPIGLAELCGSLMGKAIRQTEHFVMACELEWFFQEKFTDRIDFLRSVEFFHPRHPDIFRSSVEWQCDDQDRIDLTDTEGAFGYIHILIHPMDESIPYRYEIEDITTSDHVTWVFEKQDNEILPAKHAAGFRNWQQTKRLVLFVKWVTNVLGFVV